MSRRLPGFLRRRTTYTVLRHLIDDRRRARRFARADYSTSSGTILKRIDLAASVHYTEAQFQDYLEYGHLARTDLPGLRVLVIGPGDNLGVALLLLAHGAERVVCLDRFEPVRDPEHLVRLYRALREGLGAVERARFDAALAIISDREVRYAPERIEYVTGIGLEECGERFPAGHFDLIVSRAVLEHLYDPDRAFAALDRLLAPGGRMAHRVDLRDHGMFSADGRNPLTFLTVPTWLWRRMTARSGKPNRRRVTFYDATMRALGYDYRLYVTHVFGRAGDLVPHPPALRRGRDYDAAELALVHAIRPRLAREFRDASDEELLVSGIFLSCRKPSTRASGSFSAK